MKAHYDVFAPDPDCHKCRSLTEGINNVTEYIDRSVGSVMYRFDVSKAMKMLKDRTIVTVPPWLLDIFLDIGGVNEKHIDHVDIAHPGMIACIGDSVTFDRWPSPRTSLSQTWDRV